MQQIGIVTHYYDKIGVAIVSLQDFLDIGDHIVIEHSGHQKLDQYVNSMQLDHENIKHANKDDEVGVKVSEAVHKGDRVFKFEPGE